MHLYRLTACFGSRYAEYDSKGRIGMWLSVEPVGLHRIQCLHPQGSISLLFHCTQAVCGSPRAQILFLGM